MTNVLVLTSCNRIKQVLLALSLNAQTIKDKFSVVICDNSTPGVPAEEAVKIHESTDPYNLVKPHNYCSDISLLQTAHKYFPNIEEFRVLHMSPCLKKQQGEAALTALGFMLASLLGKRVERSTGKGEKLYRDHDTQNFALKLTGVAPLKRDILSELPEILAHKKVITWHRTCSPMMSTRIMGGRPEVLSKLFAEAGWHDWMDDRIFSEDRDDVIEQRYATLLNKHVEGGFVHYTGEDEWPYLLVDPEWSDEIVRERIHTHIKTNNMDTSETPWLKEFMDGGIY